MSWESRMSEYLRGYVYLVTLRVLRFFTLMVTSVCLTSSGAGSNKRLVLLHVSTVVMTLFTCCVELERMRRVVKAVRGGILVEAELHREIAVAGSGFGGWMTRRTFRGDPRPWWPLVGVLQGVAMALLLVGLAETFF